MNKKRSLLILALLTIIGSLFGVLSSNMLFDDLFNKGVPFSSSTIFVSLPALSITVLFILGILYIIRVNRHPNCKKRIARCYLIIGAVFSVIGIVGAILSGTNIYGTFVGSHPFPGYVLIFLILNILTLLASGCGLYLVFKWEEDTDRVKINFIYVLKSIGWVLFIGFVLNKTGLFLSFPVYVYWRNFYLTFPVYLYLLVPLTFGTLLVLYNFEVLNKKQLRLGAIITLVCNVVFFAYTVGMGLSNTAFVSSISQLMPISRMAAKPIEIIVHFLSYIGVGVALLVVSKDKKEENK